MLCAQSSSRRIAPPHRWIPAALIAAAIWIGGCDTIGQDLKDVTGGLNPTSPGEAARQMIDPHDADKRRVGLVLISNSIFGGSEVYLRTYRDYVQNDRDPIVKATAIRALARHGNPDDALLILPHLTHENVQVRWESAKGLQRLHNPAAVTGLLQTLRDEAEEADVRVAAATALGQYPQDRVVQGLVAALDARELAINLAAEKSLRQLTGQDLGLDGREWLAWYGSTAASNQAFAQQQEYFYPTYYRPDKWWEKLAFWTSRNFEKPGQPAGLRPESERRTYEEPGAATAPDAGSETDSQ